MISQQEHRIIYRTKNKLTDNHLIFTEASNGNALVIIYEQNYKTKQKPSSNQVNHYRHYRQSKNKIRQNINSYNTIMNKDTERTNINNNLQIQAICGLIKVAVNCCSVPD